MHQPLYKDPFTGEYLMPWVLYHGTKDYYDMAAILDEFPEIHQTFNLAPCLIEQLGEYEAGLASDRYRALSLKQSRDLSVEDKVFILKNFFQANWDNMIRPIPRYDELLRKRGPSNQDDDINSALRYFNERDYRDLQVLFNLAWIDPEIRRNDGFLASLLDKGREYSEDEKRSLLDRQIQIIKKILPKYAELKEKGTIEISISPYYHPILPLLCDSFSAKIAMPNATLPVKRFQHPEDALAQIKKGAAIYRKIFNSEPRGMWPSEGSVSSDILPLISGEGIRWIASDEEILSNTLKKEIRRDNHGNCHDPFLYRAYSVNAGNGDMAIVFRDHVLSDLIGFDYARMSANDASDDLITRLVRIHEMLEKPEDHIVSIILDGENAWESFKNDGRDFLVSLYSKLSSHSKLRCLTITEFLNKKPKMEPLPTLFAGSWINHNFKIWIGHPEDNAAWDCISDARDALVKYEESAKSNDDKNIGNALAGAWEELYAAEGSDWFWWYGDEHSSMNDELFDNLFRKHIRRIYTLINEEPPDSLEIPISSESKGYRPTVAPTSYIKPTIDGEVTNYYEWLSCGRIERIHFGSAMHTDAHGETLIDKIVYGFSMDSLFLRFDYLSPIASPDNDWSFTMNFLGPKALRIYGNIKGRSSKTRVFEKTPGSDKWIEISASVNMASGSVVELEIPLKTIGATAGGETRFFINIVAGERAQERWPVKGFIILDVPPEDFEAQNWMV